MRKVRVFGGSSHPALTELICARLGTVPAQCTLEKFANGEISVQIGCSIRDQDVFVVQSGSSEINDSIMELLIMISACKGASANKITAVLPYFPYSRQSKGKAQRGAITARMLANLLNVAGMDHLITLDLHAPQMQGFVKKPVDDLKAEALIARWIQQNVRDWKDAVVVSKNPGGTKRVTSLADVLKLPFGIVTTDRRRGGTMSGSIILNGVNGERVTTSHSVNGSYSVDGRSHPTSVNGVSYSPETASPVDGDDSDDHSADGRAQDVITGRLVHGQLVDDDFPSEPASMTASIGPVDTDHISEVAAVEAMMIGSMISTHDSTAAYDEGGSEEEEEETQEKPAPEKMITLVGNVRGKTVFIVDDMIDKARSWIAAAQTVVKRGGARGVYCIATHGLFGADSLDELAKCDSIDQIVVTNSCPIAAQKATGKLVVLDVSHLLSEAIRRNHFGESVSQLYQQLYD
ncbi:MAG: hypothetical protein M1823_001429 [Watsoniomyces obsoletus]|nr:MAG: hypothetical protein M1823_001429 [Watsoniomyces obsoletus]